MPRRHDYIPSRESELVPWAENFALWIGTYAQDLQITNTEISSLRGSVTFFKSLFEQAKNAAERTPFIIAQKKAARAEMVEKIRSLVRFQLQNPLAIDAMRVQLGLPPRDIIRTPHVEVTEVVEFELRLRNIREILVSFWIKGENHKAKPQGYDGAVIVWDILDSPPSGPPALINHTMASRTPHSITFTEAERGKTAYIAAAWQNERGNIGQWSEIQSAVVP